MGLIASTLLDYGSRFAEPQMAVLMRQIDDPWVMSRISACH
jgi:hypothetical protein